MSVEVIYKHDSHLGAYLINFKYSKYEWDKVKGMVGIMKLAIPASDRLYDPVTHEWTITEKYWNSEANPFKLFELLTQSGFKLKEKKIIHAEDFFYNDFVDNTPKETKDSLAAKLVDMLGITAQELQDAGLLKKIYRRKALELHPDRNGGDGSRMSELNSVWSAYNAN